jgi:hypothetical protein
MNIQYKISYFANGTKVKITSQLFNQIKQWETQNIKIEAKFLDELKKQDNDWINRTRQYYRNTIAIESLPTHLLNKEKSFRTNSFQKSSDNKIYINNIMQNLSACTDTQRRRFLMHYYLGFSLESIAKQEKCSEGAVRKSVRKVVKRIIFSKNLF